MTELLDRAIAVLRRLPQEKQDAVAVLLLDALSGKCVHKLSAEDRTAIEISRDQACRGEFVSDAEMDELWKRWS